MMADLIFTRVVFINFYFIKYQTFNFEILFRKRIKNYNIYLLTLCSGAQHLSVLFTR